MLVTDLIPTLDGEFRMRAEIEKRGLELLESQRAVRATISQHLFKLSPAYSGSISDRRSSRRIRKVYVQPELLPGAERVDRNRREEQVLFVFLGSWTFFRTL
jgi:hypothetical protein